MTDHRTVNNLTPEQLEEMSLEEWAQTAYQTEPKAAVDLVMSACKGEIPLCDAVVGGQAIYANRREQDVR